MAIVAKSLCASAVVLVTAMFWSDGARANADSTTFIGLGIRGITYTPTKSGDADSPKAKQETSTDNLSDPMLCERVSAPLSLSFEVSADGCIHGGGYWTFAHGISSHMELIYYPFAARMDIRGDSSVEVERSLIGNFYILGKGGVAKVTHGQTQNTPLTYSTDFVEFGGSVGWSFQYSQTVAFGVEAGYMLGSVMSSATSGSSSLITAGTTLTLAL